MTLPNGQTVSLYVDLQAYRSSVHGGGSCVTCHADAKAPHEKLKKVNCGKCHGDAEKSYAGSSTGSCTRKGHGRPGVRRMPRQARHPEAEGPRGADLQAEHRGHLPAMHKDRAIEQKYNLPDQKVMAAYEQSVHGMASKKSGLIGSAVCVDCHGNHGILPGDQPRSATHRQNIPTMCGKCHPGILEQYEKSVHGKGMRGGIAESPVCTDCHGEHTIARSAIRPRRSVPGTSRRRARAATRRRDLHPVRPSKKRFSSYMDSFHGIAVEYGMTKAALLLLPRGARHPAVGRPGLDGHKAESPKTCGKCHPNAGPNFAKGDVHVEISPKKAMGVFAVRIFYTIFISALVILFALHVGLELYGRWNRRKENARGGKEGQS